MKAELHWNTVSKDLHYILTVIMGEGVFDHFRLVGGTALSLQLGHRLSVDIDVFTDAEYGSIDFNAIETFFDQHFPYAETIRGMPVSFGRTWFLGPDRSSAIKVDMYYTESYIRPAQVIDSIRMAAMEDIVAMKLETILNVGRKKDFWDLHQLRDQFSISQMVGFYIERNPYGSSENEIRSALTRFSKADDDFDPVCLMGKNWEIIKLELSRWAKTD